MRVLVPMVALAMVLATAGAASSRSCAVVIGHRGASAVAPENTIRAIKKAMAVGADRVEVDVRKTSDHLPVLLHDKTLARTTDVELRHPGLDPWDVARMPYEQIRTLDAGSWKDGRFAGVPTVRATVAVGVPLLLDLKIGMRRDRLARLVSNRDVIVQTFDLEYARRVKELYPHITVWALVRSQPTPTLLAEWSTWADAVVAPAAAWDESTLLATHAAGLSSVAYTVNAADRAAALADAGVNALITDRVGLIAGAVGCA